MITEKEIQKFMADLKKKLESMVWGQVFINMKDFGPSIAIVIYSYRTINCERFKYVISLIDLNLACDCLGPDTCIDLISKRIVGEYKNAVLKLFIKEEYI